MEGEKTEGERESLSMLSSSSSRVLPQIKKGEGEREKEKYHRALHQIYKYTHVDDDDDAYTSPVIRR